MQRPKIRNIFFKKGQASPSDPGYQRNLLTGYLAIFGVLVGVYYMVYDAIEGQFGYLFAYIILALFCLASIVSIRRSAYTLAKVFFILGALQVIVLFSSVRASVTGIDIYYVIICMACIALFEFERIKIGIFLSLITVTLYLVIHIAGIQLISDVDTYYEYSETVFLTNFFICTASAILIIYYLVSTNYHSEKAMKATELNLLKISDELADSRRRFELAISGSSAGVWDWDLKKNVLYISPQMMFMLGYKQKERDGIPYDEFMSYIHPEDVEAINTKIKKHLKEREKFEMECRIRKANGTYIWVLDTGQAEWDAQGKEIRMVGSIVDINERKIAEQELNEKNSMLKKTNEELDRFVYSTSHDLRAPLSSVVGLINLAQTTDDADELQKCLVLMKDRIHTLNSFIADIISYSRNSRLEIAFETTYLDDIIKHIFTNLEYFERQKEIRIEKQFNQDFQLTTDKSRLRIILNNLITNAIKYHDLEKPDPFIIVKAWTENQHVTIEVEDNGYGIEDEYQKKIFDMFYRASVNSEGSGLGLYIAREMTEKLHGKIMVRSEFGMGSLFTLTLPQPKNSEPGNK